jgi:KaiC/GvpD/RAD55 family RecA-like ATPase
MLTLSRPLPDGALSGARLAMPITSLDRLGAVLRRSELSMVAGQPGAGKSALALHLALRGGAPALYASADTGRETMVARTLAMLSGCTQAEAERDPDWKALRGADHIAWYFESSPTVADLEAEAEAFSEVHGQPPHLIVVDNTIDVAADAGDEWGALRVVMKDLKVLARRTGAAVLACHHATEATSFSFAPARRAIQGKVSQLPALILTIDSSPEAGTMQVAIVKNRHGGGQNEGGFGTVLRFDAARMQIADMEARW